MYENLFIRMESSICPLRAICRNISTVPDLEVTLGFRMIFQLKCRKKKLYTYQG